MRSNTKSGNSVALPPAAPTLAPAPSPAQVPPQMVPVFIPRTVKGVTARTRTLLMAPGSSVLASPAARAAAAPAHAPASPAAAGSGAAATVHSSPASAAGAGAAAFKSPSPVVRKAGTKVTPAQSRRHRDILSPNTYAVFFIPPDPSVFGKINELTAIDLGLADRASDLLRRIYYPLLRPGDPSSVSIGGALATERKDDVLVNGARHDIKAVGFLKPLREIIAELQRFKLSEARVNERKLLTYLESYFTLQLHSLQGELKRLKDVDKIKVEHHLKQQFRGMLYQSPPQKTPDQKKMVEELHGEELLFTPPKLTPRSQAVRRGLKEKGEELAAILRGDIEPPKLVDAKASAKPAAVPAVYEQTKKRKRELDFTLPAATAEAGDAKEKSLSAASPSAPAVAAAPVPAAAPAPLAAERPAVTLMFKSKVVTAAASETSKVKLSQLPNIFANIDAARMDPNAKSKKLKLDALQQELAADAKAHGLELLSAAFSAPGK